MLHILEREAALEGHYQGQQQYQAETHGKLGGGSPIGQAVARNPFHTIPQQDDSYRRCRPQKPILEGVKGKTPLFVVPGYVHVALDQDAHLAG